MKKKSLVLLLIMNCLLCVLLGYHIAMIHLTSEETGMTNGNAKEVANTETTVFQEAQTEDTANQSEVISTAEKYTQATEESSSVEYAETNPVYTHPSMEDPVHSNLGENEMPPVIRGN